MRFRTTRYTAAAAALAVGLTVSLAACTGSSTATVDQKTASASSTPTPVASIPDLSKGVDTEVAVDPAFAADLDALDVTPGVAGTATFAKGTFSFPITGGSVSYYDPAEAYRPYVQGDIQHQGSGMTLTAGSTKVTLSNFDIDPGASKLYGDVAVNGTTAVKHAYLFALWGGTLQPLKTVGSNAVLTGTTVHVSPDAAKLLNSTFKTAAIASGLLVGVATITVAAQ